MAACLDGGVQGVQLRAKALGTRPLLDLALAVRRLTVGHGARLLVNERADLAIAAGADGVHVEVHDCPEKALSDGPQALLPDAYDALLKDLRRLAKVVGKTID